MQVHKQTEKYFREKNHIALLKPVFYICTDRGLNKQVLFKVTAGCVLILTLDMVKFSFPLWKSISIIFKGPSPFVFLLSF